MAAWEPEVDSSNSAMEWLEMAKKFPTVTRLHPCFMGPTIRLEQYCIYTLTSKELFSKNYSTIVWYIMLPVGLDVKSSPSIKRLNQ